MKKSKPQYGYCSCFLKIRPIRKDIPIAFINPKYIQYLFFSKGDVDFNKTWPDKWFVEMKKGHFEITKEDFEMLSKVLKSRSVR